VKISGHTFLITGGASGLGAATARSLSLAGASIVIVDVSEQVAQREVRAIDMSTLCVQADVTDETQVAAAIDRALNHFGSLHGAINCAGIAIGERILGWNGPHRLDSFARTVQVNLTGTFNVMRLAASAMEKNEPEADGERGVIVNTASIAAFDGQIGQVAYSASKAGIAGMTLPAARELARVGIRVMTIAPGIFETPMMASMSAEIRTSVAAQTPFPARLGRGDEYAALVMHIIENVMLNGEVIRIDGAMRMGPK
jgi:NAD(P)-dependent dehydrogenase (short-subunit alcohol dehydrogenase family)